MSTTDGDASATPSLRTVTVRSKTVAYRKHSPSGKRNTHSSRVEYSIPAARSGNPMPTLTDAPLLLSFRSSIAFKGSTAAVLTRGRADGYVVARTVMVALACEPSEPPVHVTAGAANVHENP